MSEIGAGPLWRIDGPPPVAPKYGLIQAARTAPVVRVVADADSQGRERWINGVALAGWPTDPASVWDACALHDASPEPEKESGDAPPLPKFDAFTVYLPISCTSYQVPDQDAFRARAVAALTAVEGKAVEREFLAADTMVMNPHPSDGEGDFPNLDAATTIANGLALLEEYLASFGKAGIIHVSPSVATAAGQALLYDEGGNLRTFGGTAVVVGTGYADGPTPSSHTDAADTEEWIYASGPVDIRRSEIFTLPETPAQALDRGSGATMDVPNQIVYRAERYYVAVWDTAVQAAVLVDRCADSC